MKRAFTFPLLAAILLTMSRCTTTPTKETGILPTCDGIRQFFTNELERYQTELDSAAKNYQEEQWRVETADPKGSLDKMGKLFGLLQSAGYDKKLLARAIALSDGTSNLTLNDCPVKVRLNRVRQLLETSILTQDTVIQKEKENQELQDRLGMKSNSFRIAVPGEKEPISKALYLKKLGVTKDKTEREKLFKSFNFSRAQRWLEWDFKGLVKARNEEARMAGFKNYYEYRFFRNQLDLKNYTELSMEIKRKLAPKAIRTLKKIASSFGIKKIDPWDFVYIRNKFASGEIDELLKDLPEQSALELAREFYSELGIDIDRYRFIMDLFPRAGKNTHAFAMVVIFPHVDEKGQLKTDPKSDIRFLANLKKPVKWNDVSTVIHELGHAIHGAEVRQPTGIFRGFGSVETEAIAMTFERMAESQEYYESVLPKYTAVSIEKLRPLLRKQLKALKIEQAFVLLRQVFFSAFEREIYMNPDQDFGLLWSKMEREYWGFEISPEMSGWDVDHYVMSPVYVQNYALGIVIVEQLYGSMLREFKTGYKSKELGGKIRRTYFYPGVEFPYLDLVEQFTGRPLSAKASLRLLD